MKGRWEPNLNVSFPAIYSFPEIKFLFTKQIKMFCLPVPLLIYLWEIYIFPDQSAYSAAGKYVDDPGIYI
jgi:hypothetical protein